jgi:quinol monooxygenase YgiN
VIHVIALLTAKPGKRAALLEEFRKVIPAVHAEAGCIEYGPAIDLVGSSDSFGEDVLVVIEKWESPEALKAHSIAPHMKAYGERAKDLLAARAVHVLTPA